MGRAGGPGAAARPAREAFGVMWAEVGGCLPPVPDPVGTRALPVAHRGAPVTPVTAVRLMVPEVATSAAPAVPATIAVPVVRSPASAIVELSATRVILPDAVELVVELAVTMLSLITSELAVPVNEPSA